MSNHRATSSSPVFRLGTLRSAIAAALTVAAALSQAETLRAMTTDLTSNSERMVSYRHQDHLSQTTDGALHLVFNRGTLPNDPGLVLYSSFDGGSTWTLMATFANTDADATADARLSGDELRVAYPTVSGALMVSELRYDSVNKRWLAVRQETAYASTKSMAFNAACASDEPGAVWCAFVNRDKRSNATNLRLIVRLAIDTPWIDTGLVFGPTETRLIERSARPVQIPGGMGLVYTVHEFTYWATRTNAMAATDAWTSSVLYQGTPKKPIEDPYSSHFSVASDDAGALHALLIDEYGVLSTRNTFDGQGWSKPKRMNDSGKAVYSQIGMANGRPVVAFSVQRGKGAFYSSSDGGVNYVLTNELQLPPPAADVSYGTARVEMPSRNNDVVTVLQQYSESGTQRLMLFKVTAP